MGDHRRYRNCRPDLGGARLGAHLSQAELAERDLHRVSFADADLTDVKWPKEEQVPEG